MYPFGIPYIDKWYPFHITYFKILYPFKLLLMRCLQNFPRIRTSEPSRRLLKYE